MRLANPVTLLARMWSRLGLDCGEVGEDSVRCPLLSRASPLPAQARLGDLPIAPGSRRSVWTPWGAEPERDYDAPLPPPYALPDKPAPAPAPPALPPPPPDSEPPRRQRPLPPLAPHRVFDQDWVEHEPAHRPQGPREEESTPRGGQPRRLGRSAYDAVETHGSFGLIDSGRVSHSIREVVAHVPKRCRGSFLTLRAGDRIRANSARGRPVGGDLDVVYVTPYKYYAPGRAVTSCRIGVPDEQWRRFAAVGEESDE